jgi:hypothetical protein
MRYVSVGLTGSVWGVGDDYVPYYRSGIDKDAPYGTGWETVAGAEIKQLEAGNC